MGQKTRGLFLVSKIKENILVTGSAGFIGFHLASKLVKKNVNIINVDNLNDYYQVSLKMERIKHLKKLFKDNKKKFILKKIDISNKDEVLKIFKKYKFSKVIHLAAQAGVRYSFINPRIYAETNLMGFFNILEGCRIYKVKNLIFASSSSVYGESKKFPYKENEILNTPLQFYASTKLSNEIMSYSYSMLYNINVIGLRFFTVYGPWGRPDMAYFSFTKKILSGKAIEVFNHGKHFRDFTFIDDIIKGVLLTIFKKPKKKYQILNIGYGKPVKLMDLIKYLEKFLGKKAKIKYLNKQKGDMDKTFSSIDTLKRLYGYKPNTNPSTGLKKFVDWYLNFYR